MTEEINPLNSLPLMFFGEVSNNNLSVSSIDHLTTPLILPERYQRMRR